VIFVCALAKFSSAEIASNQCFLGGFLMVLIWNVKTFKKKKKKNINLMHFQLESTSQSIAKHKIIKVGSCRNLTIYGFF
jgi:hypothetical protein